MTARKKLGLTVMAKRIYALSQRIKEDTEEMKELREALQSKMKVGQVLHFDTLEGTHRMKLADCQETILKTNAEIREIVGTEVFEKAAKIGVRALQTAIKENAPEGQLRSLLEAFDKNLKGQPWEVGAFNLCVKAVVSTPTLKLLKGRE